MKPPLATFKVQGHLVNVQYWNDVTFQRAVTKLKELMTMNNLTHDDIEPVNDAAQKVMEAVRKADS